MFHIFTFTDFFILHGFITNSQYDQLPVGLIAQLVATVPASQRSWVRIPFKPEFFQAFLSQLLKLCHGNCEDLSSICSFFIGLRARGIL